MFPIAYSHLLIPYSLLFWVGVLCVADGPALVEHEAPLLKDLADLYGICSGALYNISEPRKLQNDIHPKKGR